MATREQEFLQTMAPAQMTITCKKCTRQESFGADRIQNAIEIAVKKGWVKDGNDYICPKCPAVRA